MKNQWRILIGILLILLIVLFAVANNMPVPVNFGFTEIEGPLILIIIGSAFIGAIIVSLVSTGTIIQQKRKISELQKENHEFQHEMETKLTDEKEALEREYANKMADLTTREQQLNEAQAQLTQQTESLENNAQWRE